MNFCGKCGAKLMDGNAFCTNCGAKVSDYGVKSNTEQPSGTQPDYEQGNTQKAPEPEYNPGYQDVAPQNFQGYYTNNNDGQPFSQQSSGNYSHYSQQFYRQQNTHYSVKKDMSLFDFFVKCLRNYANFKGRARRKEYWGYILFYMLFLIGGFIVALIIDSILGVPIFTILVEISVWAFIIPTIAVSVRRLHDTGKSGWWYFIIFIPLVGAIWFFVLMVLDSDQRTNIYGPPAKEFMYYR